MLDHAVRLQRRPLEGVSQMGALLVKPERDHEIYRYQQSSKSTASVVALGLAPDIPMTVLANSDTGSHAQGLGHHMRYDHYFW